MRFHGQAILNSAGFCEPHAWLIVKDKPPLHCVTLSKLLKHSMPLAPHLYNGDNTNHLRDLL